MQRTDRQPGAHRCPAPCRPCRRIGNAISADRTSPTRRCTSSSCAPSQINGCAFCLDMHWKDAQGSSVETDERLYMVAAWREARVLRRPRRTGRAGAHRGGHPDRRRPGGRPGRRLGAGRGRVRRRGARPGLLIAIPADQRLEPPQRRHAADQRGMGGPVARHEGDRRSRSLGRDLLVARGRGRTGVDRVDDSDHHGAGRRGERQEPGRAHRRLPATHPVRHDLHRGSADRGRCEGSWRRAIPTAPTTGRLPTWPRSESRCAPGPA